MEVTATTSTVGEMFVRLKKKPSNVLLMDINLTKNSNLGTVPKFKKNYPDLKIIALSIYQQHKFVETVIEEGCHGYILKNSTKTELITGIHQVVQGETYVSKGLYIPSQSGEIDYEKSQHYRTEFLKRHNLTRREVDIISLVVQGHSNKQIAEFLYISEYTVKAHRRNLKAKLHLSNTADLIRFAFQTGIVQP